MLLNRELTVMKAVEEGDEIVKPMRCNIGNEVRWNNEGEGKKEI